MGGAETARGRPLALGSRWIVDGLGVFVRGGVRLPRLWSLG